MPPSRRSTSTGYRLLLAFIAIVRAAAAVLFLLTAASASPVAAATSAPVFGRSDSRLVSASRHLLALAHAFIVFDHIRYWAAISVSLCAPSMGTLDEVLDWTSDILSNTHLDTVQCLPLPNGFLSHGAQLPRRAPRIAEPLLRRYFTLLSGAKCLFATFTFQRAFVDVLYSMLERSVLLAIFS